MENSTAQTGLDIKLSDQKFVEMTNDICSKIIDSDDSKKAFDIFKMLEEKMLENQSELQMNEEVSKFYKNFIIKLKFIALPLLDDVDVINLIKDHFNEQFMISDYDLLHKFKYKLIGIIVESDRDKLKSQLINALSKSNSAITPRAILKTVGQWINDYNSKVGLGSNDSLKNIEYLSKINYIGLDEISLKKVNTLFNLLKNLKQSTFVPEGFEEELPVMIDNKIYIFRQGVLEPIYGGSQKVLYNNNFPKTPEEKKIEELKQVQTNEAKTDLEKMAIDEEIEEQKKIEDFKIMANKFPAGSLERRAIEEEIKKLSN